MTGQSEETRQLHDTLDYIGLRAHATTAGLLQLCTELVRAGAIDHAAVERIKSAIHSEIMLTQGRRRDRDEFSGMLKERLDAIFPQGQEGQRGSSVGDINQMKTALDSNGRDGLSPK
ncbi:MAG: hypothetical protein ACK4QP_14310 [Pseudorhizobium sp.]